MTVAVIIGGAIAAWLLHKHKAVSGIGKVAKAKRRIFAEMEAAQQGGIDFNTAYDDLSAAQRKTLEDIARRNNYKQSSASTKPYTEAYYNSLRRQYNAISGTNLPYSTSVVYNENGDPIITYRDYGTDEQKLQRAINWVQTDYASVSNPELYGYIMAVVYIAQGGKLIWSDKKQNGVLEECFGGGKQPAERKARISYLASRAKGGITPNMLAHRIWESTDGTTDDKLIKDGVLQAIMGTESVGAARDMILNTYYDAHQVQEYTEVPF